MAYSGQPILTRKRLIALKTETTLGTAESLTAAEAVWVVENPEMVFEPNAVMVQSVGHHGMRQVVSGARPAALNFDWLLHTGSTSPAFMDTLFEACGLIRTNAIYTHQPDNCSANGLSGAIWRGTGAAARKELIAGAFGELTFNFATGQPVRVNVGLMGKMPSVPAADTAPDPTFVALTYPLFRGATFTIDSVEFPVDAFSLKLGNVVVLREHPTHADASGYLSAWIADCSPTITVAPEAAAFSIANFYDKYFGTANTVAVSAVVGTAANNIATFSLPTMALTSPPTAGDRNGLLTDNLNLQVINTAAGYSGGLTITLS